MTAGLKLFDKRLASLTVIAVVVVAALVLVLDTLVHWQRESATLAELEHHIGVLEARAAAVSGRKTDEDPYASDGHILIAGDTPGLAAAEFQRRLTVIAERNGAVVRAIDTPESQMIDGIADAEGKALQRVRLSIDLEVMEQALPDLLHAVETDFPLTIVEGLSLRVNRSIGGAGGWVSSADQPLALRLAVAGFRTQRVE